MISARWTCREVGNSGRERIIIIHQWSDLKFNSALQAPSEGNNVMVRRLSEVAPTHGVDTIGTASSPSPLSYYYYDIWNQILI